mgnify:CR=1 FL=1
MVPAEIVNEEEAEILLSSNFSMDDGIQNEKVKKVDKNAINADRREFQLFEKNNVENAIK